MLAASGISVTLGGTPILRDVPIAVRGGEVVALIGPNGAGKSTLLHVLSGAIAPDAGEVCLDGRPLAAWPRRVLARRRAVLPQTPVLSFPFRVLDVALLGRSPHVGRSGRDADMRVAHAALAETGMLDLVERVYTTLSGGERQRAELSRVLAQIWPEPEQEAGEPGRRFVLLDEPANNLDLAHQNAIMVTAKRLATWGHGVLAVLHDPNLAAVHADRICVLGQGRMVADGPPCAVVAEDLFERVFGTRVRVIQHPEHGCPIVLPV